MKLILAFLFVSFGYAQNVVQNYVVDCSQNTVIRDTTIVKKLIFVSRMLPMSYNAQLTVYSVEGKGVIVSPTTEANAVLKDGDSEPEVIVMGCRSEFTNLIIGKRVKVKYMCYDILTN